MEVGDGFLRNVRREGSESAKYGDDGSGKALFADDKPVWTSEKRDFFRYICRRLKSRNIRKRR